MSEWVPDGYEFALCLTHDVDRPFKTYQSVYYALRERDLTHLAGLLPWTDPYWTFEDLMDLEADLGVTSAFYFLNEQDLFADRPPGEWFTSEGWRLFAGRYDISDPDIVSLIRDIDRRGWEVGIHGSHESYDDRERLGYEKRVLEDILGHTIRGGRQHYLNLETPDTWEHHRAIGLEYDASPGSSSEYGFHDGYDPYHPFDDEFVVFPLTLMEVALPDPRTSMEDAWQACESVLAEAVANDAVVTALWHPRYFSTDFEGYDDVYRRLIERALDMGAWVGPPGDLYRHYYEGASSERANEMTH